MTRFDVGIPLVVCLSLLTALGARCEPPGEGSRTTPAAARPRADQDEEPLPPGAVARLGTVRLRHTMPVQKLGFSPDGKTLASSGRSIRMWDAATGKQLQRWRFRTAGPIRSFDYSPDGTTLACTDIDSHDRDVCLLDVTSGKER